MAILTALSEEEVQACARAFGVSVVSSSGVMAGSVNTNLSLVDDRGARWFLRLYEEQDALGAAREARLLTRLSERGVRTPAPRPRTDGAGFVQIVRGKPACLFAFVDGVHRCQRGVTPSDARAVGAALARIHRVGESFAPDEGLTAPSRFSVLAMEGRLSGLDDAALPADVRDARALLRERLAGFVDWTPRAADIPLIHGDLFRDNVLFDGDEATLLDFESASFGSASFDLAVTLLAWCFGDGLDAGLARAIVEGYASVRSLSRPEIEDLPRSAELACLRFATTRITDYELRPRGAGVYKDYRRWLARLATIDASFGLRGATLDITLRDIWPT